VKVISTGGQNRSLIISETDATPGLRNIAVISPGDNIIITNSTAPVTEFARYVVTGAGVDNGTWWAIPMVLTDGNQPVHDPEEPVRVYASFASLAPLTLDQLSDVTAPTPTNGQALLFETASGQWKPGTVATGSDPLKANLSGATFTGEVDVVSATAVPSVSARQIHFLTTAPTAGLGADGDIAIVIP
jgi:hypothetical protein